MSLLESVIDDLSDLIVDVEAVVEEHDNHPQARLAVDGLEKARSRLFEVYMESGGGVVRRIHPKW